MDLIQNEDYPADSCAISPTTSLLLVGLTFPPHFDFGKSQKKKKKKRIKSLRDFLNTTFVPYYRRI